MQITASPLCLSVRDDHGAIAESRIRISKGGKMPTRLQDRIYIYIQRDGDIILRCCLNRRPALPIFETVMTDEWKNRANRLGLTGQPLLPLRSPEILVCRSPAPRNCAARQRTRAFWGHSTSTSSSQLLQLATTSNPEICKCAANPTLARKSFRTTPLFSIHRWTVCFGPIPAHRDLQRLLSELHRRVFRSSHPATYEWPLTSVTKNPDCLYQYSFSSHRIKTYLPKTNKHSPIADPGLDATKKKENLKFKRIAHHD